MEETQLQGRQSRERTKRGTLSVKNLAIRSNRMLKKMRSFGVRIGYIAEQDKKFPDVPRHNKPSSLNEKNLLSASSEGKLEVIKQLLERGTEVDIQDGNGVSALMWACQNGHKEAAELLLERGAQVGLLDNEGRSPLTAASNSGHTEVVKLLLERGAQVDLQDNGGSSSLMWASDKGQTEVVKLLLERGAQVDLRDNEGRSPLMAASNSGQTEVVKLLLESGAQVDLQDNEKKSALIWASRNSEIVELLLKRGAQVDLQDNDGWSALMWAEETEVVELLLERGAEMDLRNNDGKTALEVNDKLGYFDAVELLQKKSVQTTTNLCGTSNLYGSTFYYSARLYRRLSHNSAIFCMCLYSEVYTKHCDKVMKEVGGKDWEVSTITSELTSEEVCLSVTDGIGWKVIFDTEPTKIMKKEIHIPEELHRGIEECPDYPPRRLIQFLPIQLDPSTERSNPIKLRVDGLDFERYFNITVPNPTNAEFSNHPKSGMVSTSPSATATNLSSISIKNSPGPHQPSSWSQDEPTLCKAFRILYPIASEWENIGTLLDLSPDQLSNIKNDNDGVQNCLREMVKLWLKQVTVRPTWQSLADAVSLIDPRITLKISETYKK